MATENPGETEPGVSGGHFTNTSTDDSPAAIQWQHYQLGLTARGASLGIGRRTVPSPASQFSSPPISNDQFGSGGGARSTMSGTVD